MGPFKPLKSLVFFFKLIILDYGSERRGEERRYIHTEELKEEEEEEDRELFAAR